MVGYPILYRRYLSNFSRYADHLYIGLVLQKLVHLDQIIDERDSESANDESIVHGLEGAKRRGLFSRNKVGNRLDEYKGFGLHQANSEINAEDLSRPSKGRQPDLRTPQTLQEYNGYGDKERIAYMETHSALASKKLVVITDRVSIFLTAGKKPRSTKYVTLKRAEAKGRKTIPLYRSPTHLPRTSNPSFSVNWPRSTPSSANHVMHL